MNRSAFGPHAPPGALLSRDGSAVPTCSVDPGNMTFGPAATLTIEIAGPTPCTGHDWLTVQQRLTLNGPRLRVVFADGYVPPAGQTFDIVDGGTLAGTFGTIEFIGDGRPPGYTWNLDNLYATGGITPDALPVPTPVPLPGGALVLLPLGLVAVGTRVCRVAMPGRAGGHPAQTAAAAPRPAR